MPAILWYVLFKFLKNHSEATPSDNSWMFDDASVRFFSVLLIIFIIAMLLCLIQPVRDLIELFIN